MAVIVRETTRQKPRTVVKRIKLGEVWISVPCNTYCKMDYINGEHQFRDKTDPGRRPMKGTEKGKQAEEADNAFYAPTKVLRRGVQEVWAVWPVGSAVCNSARMEAAQGATCNATAVGVVGANLLGLLNWAPKQCCMSGVTVILQYALRFKFESVDRLLWTVPSFQLPHRRTLHQIIKRPTHHPLDTKASPAFERSGLQQWAASWELNWLLSIQQG